MTKKVQDQLAVFDRSDAWKNNTLAPEYPSDHPHRHGSQDGGAENDGASPTDDNDSDDDDDDDEGTTFHIPEFGAGIALGLLVALVSHLCCKPRGRRRSDNDGEERAREPLII